MNTKVVLAVIAMIGLLIVGACGDSSNSGSTGGATTKSTQSDVSSDAAAMVDIMETEQPETVENFCTSLSVMDEDTARGFFMQGWNEDNVGETLNVDPNDLFDEFASRCN